MTQTISRSTEVNAPAEKVWALVSDLPGMGRLSPENTGGKWVGGATGPVVGARFKGTNKNGVRRWSTSVQVTRADPGRSFAFAVTYLGIPVANWAYDIAETEGGCTVTESWGDRRPAWFAKVGGLATGVADREQATATNLERTLAAVKAAAEG